MVSDAVVVSQSEGIYRYRCRGIAKSVKATGFDPVIASSNLAALVK